ncbi:MAG: DUF1641 domain-containing protein [Myxococcales bacterium]|nr:DUF1641 domain-containing protein [Myxococcales bacterium]MCB9693625.1 DUF1641 domain-containing protein [Alphaproteobacteria bacterium]
MSDASTVELLNEVLERLTRLEARLDAIQGTTDAVAPLASKLPVIVEGAASTAQFAWDQAEAKGIDPIASGLTALDIATVAGQAESLATVKRLLAHQGLLNKTLDTVEALDADGTLDKLVAHGSKMGPRVAALLDTPAVASLLDQALDEPKVVETAAAATSALVETRKSGWAPAGLFAPLSAMMDKDVQKAVGFSLAILKRLGQKL